MNDTVRAGAAKSIAFASAVILSILISLALATSATCLSRSLHSVKEQYTLNRASVAYYSFGSPMPKQNDQLWFASSKHGSFETCRGISCHFMKYWFCWAFRLFITGNPAESESYAVCVEFRQFISDGKVIVGFDILRCGMRRTLHDFSGLLSRRSTI